MLKKVHVSQIKLGMFIHRLEGDWLDHPFWKTRFVLKTERDLQKLRASVIQEIWIDPALGLDLEPDPETAAAAPLPEPKIPEQAADAVPVEQLPLDRPTAELDSEIGKASAIVRRAKQQLAQLFAVAKGGDAPALEGAHALAGDVAESVMRHPSALVSLSRLKAQEDYVYLHSLAVSALMVALARQMGMDEERCRLAGLAGLLHNVGMAMVPAEIIRKKGKLSDEETFVVRAHPVQGYEMLKSQGDPGGLPASSRALGRGRLSLWPGGRGHPAVCSHVCHLRCLRRDHFQPVLPLWLGPRGVHSADGFLDRAV
jgi:HD-GYP domain-containing protein (c-di-GMP phosphodiesterase class II)